MTSNFVNKMEKWLSIKGSKLLKRDQMEIVLMSKIFNLKFHRRYSTEDLSRKKKYSVNLKISQLRWSSLGNRKKRGEGGRGGKKHREEETDKHWRKLWNTINCTYTHNGCPKSIVKREKGIKNIEEIMARNFPNFIKSMNPYVQEAQ